MRDSVRRKECTGSARNDDLAAVDEELPVDTD